MTNDIIAVIIFIIALCIMCKTWNLFAMKQIKLEAHLGLTYGFYNENNLKLAGTGNGSNGDYNASEAIKKVDLPTNIRIKAL